MPNLQNHTTSYELSEELHDLCKEKGIVLPESLFSSHRYSTTENGEIVTKYRIINNSPLNEDLLNCVPAYLSSELGEILMRHTPSKYEIGTELNGGKRSFIKNEYVTIYQTNEANARCEMLIYLIKNNLIEL